LWRDKLVRRASERSCCALLYCPLSQVPVCAITHGSLTDQSPRLRDLLLAANLKGGAVTPYSGSYCGDLLTCVRISVDAKTKTFRGLNCLSVHLFRLILSEHLALQVQVLQAWQHLSCCFRLAQHQPEFLTSTVSFRLSLGDTTDFKPCPCNTCVTQQHLYDKAA